MSILRSQWYTDSIFGDENMHYYYYYDENGNIVFIQSTENLTAEYLIEITKEEYFHMCEELGIDPI